MDQTKREFREQKRVIKRLGNKHRRRQLKRLLDERPEEAPDAIGDFGRFRSAPLNGQIDHDRTRMKIKTRSGSQEDPAASSGA